MKKQELNILLITADQWRGDCLSSLGHPVVKTPHLDGLAAEGMMFTRHYSNAVPCGPSRASLHTGMYLHNHRSGTNGTPLDKRFTNWASESRRAGRDPVLFGYTHTAQDPRVLPPNDDRLQTDEGILPDIRPIIDMATHCPDWRRYLASRGYENLPAFDGALYGIKGKPVSAEVPTPTQYQPEDSDTAFLTNSLMDFIDSETSGWTAHLSLRAPHPPWVATAPYHEHYGLETLPEPVRHGTLEAESALHPWLDSHLKQPRAASHADLHRHRLLQASYYGLMSEVDHHIGRLVSFLKAKGQWDNTCLIFTSDHGEQMGDHWMYGKAGFFEQSYHIPLIISGPGVIPGRCEAFTEHVDIMPTILDLLALEVPRQCDGESLTNWLAGKEVNDWRQAAHYEFDFRHSQTESALGLDMEEACLNVIRDAHYKYVHFVDLPPLLFDLQQDPGELHNLADDHPELVARYASQLLNWRLCSTDKTLSHLQVVREQGLIDHLGNAL